MSEYADEPTTVESILPNQAELDFAQLKFKASMFLEAQIYRNLMGNYHEVRTLVADTIDHLRPKHEIEMDGKSFLTSDVMLGRDENRPFALVYHDPESKWAEELNPTVFYRSNSHIAWRALLKVGPNGWHAKNMFGAENSADAPLDLQKMLSGLEADSKVPTKIDYSAQLVDKFGYDCGYDDEPRMMSGARLLAQTFMVVNDVMPRADLKIVSSSNDGKLFIDSKKPVFSNVQSEWVTRDTIYGDVTSRIVPSKDWQIRYLFNSAVSKEGEEQHWLATAEFTGSGTSGLGIKHSFPRLPESLMEPPIEYERPDAEGIVHGYEDRRTETSRLDQFVVRSIAAKKRR